MKDFIKWLGVNEKIAKVAVWMLIFMVMLILTNTMLESIGFPHYAITYDNLKQIKMNKAVDSVAMIITVFLNFCSIALLVFRTKEIKQISKYALLYMLLNAISTKILGPAATHVFIIMFLIAFAYTFSNKNKKYIIYIILSLIFNTIIQGIWYMSKARFIDYTQINYITKTILSLDFFIIMAVIILVKEIYLKKRGEKR